MATYATYLIVNDVDLGQNGLDGYNYYFIDATNNNINITLTTNFLGNGLYFYFLRVDNSSNTVIFSTQSGYTVNNSSTMSLNTNQGCEMIFNNNNWVAPRYLYN